MGVRLPLKGGLAFLFDVELGPARRIESDPERLQSAKLLDAPGTRLLEEPWRSLEGSWRKGAVSSKGLRGILASHCNIRETGSNASA